MTFKLVVSSSVAYRTFSKRRVIKTNHTHNLQLIQIVKLQIFYKKQSHMIYKKFKSKLY